MLELAPLALIRFSQVRLADTRANWAMALVCALSAVMTGFAAQSLQAADPVLNDMQPYGLQRGTVSVVKFRGARLADAQQLMFYRPGIELQELVSRSGQELEARLAVADDCVLGFHGVRIRTASGISNLQTLSVGALPTVSEKEPNSSFDTPQALELGCTVNGVIKREDVDYFVIQVEEGQRISVELEGVRLGMRPNNNTFFDPFIAVLDTNRFEIVRCDDATLVHQDCLCNFQAPSDGSYVIEVRESSYQGSDLCKYRLHVGQFPRPTAVYPAGGQPGHEITVDWLGDTDGVIQSTMVLPTSGAETLEVFAEDERGIAPSPLRMRVNQLTNVLELEPNDARDKATVCTVPAALNGIIQEPSDRDHFRFAAQKGQKLNVRVYARSILRSPLDALIRIRKANGAQVGSNDDTGGPDSVLAFTAPEDGEYLIEIYDHLLRGGPDYVYRVEVTSFKPGLTLGLPERVRYKPITVSVPQGNRMGVMVSARREGLSSELELALQDLPEGISVAPLTIPAGQSTLPVIFSAQSDAQIASSLVDLVGRGSRKDDVITGQLEQRTMLVRGQNNRDVWGHDARRVAVAVTEAVPFSLQIQAPKAPIVPNGSMKLTVKADRAEGFNEPIAISMLYNPPGIGSSAALKIPADKDQAVIPLTANSKATPGQWPLVVIGQAKVGDGNIEVATEQVPLEIGEVYLAAAIQKTAGELGAETVVQIRLDQKRPFPATGTARLMGLPAKTSLADDKPLEFTPETTQLAFRVKIAPDARPGKFQTLVCQATVTIEGEPVVHTFRGGELRVDKPLVVKPAASASKEGKKSVAAKTKPADKPLTRLEQLRQQRSQQQQN